MALELTFDRCSCELVANSGFLPAGGRESQMPLVCLMERITGARYTNGHCVRIEGIRLDGSDATLGLSEASFFDLVSTNIVLMNVDRALDEAVGPERDALDALLLEHRSCGEPASVEDVLSRSYLSNVLAASCLIVDDAHRCLLTRRSTRVGIGGGHLSVSVTGSVEPVDLNSENPIVACCVRECAEELAFDLPAESVRVSGIVCGERKLQPIALVTARVNSVERVVERVDSAADFALENSGYVICSREELRKLLDDTSITITEAGRAQLEGVAL